MTTSKEVKELLNKLRILEKANDRLLEEEIKHLSSIKNHLIQEHTKIKKYEKKTQELKEKKIKTTKKKSKTKKRGKK